ncbi:MAG: ATP synthase F1 subunit gamma [Oscillospiraceae bacterium]
MAGVTEIKMRMNSVKDTMKITNAMYLISSSKLKKARKMLLATEPYFNKLQQTIHHILAHAPNTQNRFFDQHKAVPDAALKRAYIVVTADKGLAGAYNHNITKLSESIINQDCSNVILPIGQMGKHYFSRKGFCLQPEFFFSAHNPTMYEADCIAHTALDLYTKGEAHEVYIVYTKMVTSMKSQATALRILPLDKNNFLENDLPDDGNYITNYQPNEHTVLDCLVPNYVKGLLFGALVEAFSSEQNERMMAMDAATTSAKDMIKALSLQFNRARQAAITQEITEISSGAKSLKK